MSSRDSLDEILAVYAERFKDIGEIVGLQKADFARWCA